MTNPSEVKFYEELFTRDPIWSSSWPNHEEAPRAAVIISFVTKFAISRDRGDLKILDIGCGRGWLTYMLQAYGKCLGIDPIGPVIDHAQKLFPVPEYRVGTTTDLIPEFSGSFDVIVMSEVIEHVPECNRNKFLEEIDTLLAPDGAIIVSTDRGELYKAWTKTQPIEQPVEEWLTEPQLRKIFENRGFQAIAHDRIYWDNYNLSFLHRLVASQKVAYILTATRQTWLLHGMRYLAGFGQAWMFTRRKAPLT